MNILQNIRSHEDLVKLDRQQQAVLCQQIRQFLVESVSKTGGHLASNLGMVEVTVALETVYNTEIDRLVFDVGHQSYVHKLLTGRQADFANLRQYGGIAGFPKPCESAADAFVAGHASSSVSIALGMARARTLQQQDYHVVAVLGDGAATGGMVYEALNDAAVSGEPMVIILNDNEMSIAPNVGGFAQHLSRLRTKESYMGLKQRYRHALTKTKLGRGVYHATRSIKQLLKKVLLQPTIFENMGLSYLGPVDGHDLPGLIALLSRAKTMRRPVVVHVQTQKGRGYAPAQENPAKFHGVGKFDPETGETLSAGKVTFSNVFGSTLCRLAAEDPKVCAITAAMPAGTGLSEFAKTYPGRTFDVGIAEEHAVSMAGGLAKQGLKPVVALYSTFLQRGYDQILQDIAMLGLHVVLAVDRAGLVGEDGETHHGVFDAGFLCRTPGMQVLCPATTAQLEQMLSWAVRDCNGPVAVRYPRGGDVFSSQTAWTADMDVICHKNGCDGVILTYGTLTQEALQAAQILQQQGKDVAVVQLCRIAPLNLEQMEAAIGSHHRILIAEEASGGMAQNLAFLLQQADPARKIAVADLGCRFVTHGATAQLYTHCGISAADLAKKMMEVQANEN